MLYLMESIDSYKIGDFEKHKLEIERQLRNVNSSDPKRYISFADKMISMLMGDLKRVYDEAYKINPSKARKIWFNYRYDLTQEIRRVNSSNLLEFNPNKFRKHTVKAIVEFQEIIKHKPESKGYQFITSESYKNFLLHLRNYIYGLGKAIDIFNRQRGFAYEKAVAQTTQGNVIDLDQITIESENNLKEHGKNILINSIFLGVLYLSSVAIMKKKGISTYKFIDFKKNFLLMLDIAIHSEKYGFILSSYFKFVFIVIGIGIFQMGVNLTIIIKKIMKR